MLNSKKKCNFAALFVFSAKTLSIKTQKTHTKHTMVHLTNTLRSATFFLGTAMLMLFFFCAPVHAQFRGFKSTSAYQINASAQNSAINAEAAYQPYRSTIYQPFSESAPTSNNPSDGSSGINGRRNANVGIPSWGGTMSEPLPIGDTAPLFFFAAAMIAIIRIRQRKQQRLTTQTQPTNNNDTTQHMTTRKQTYQSLRQKLFLLLAFVCFVGQVSADKTIYFRPSTTAFRYGYTDYNNMSDTWNSVYWTKGVENFFPIELRTTNTSSYTSSWTTYSNLIHASQIVGGTKSRFISITVPDNYKYIVAYRCAPKESYSLTEDRYNAWKNSSNKGKETTYIANQNTIPKKSGSQPSSPELIPTDGRNLLCNKEGWWDVWYWAYYLPTTNDVKLYFDNSNGWSNVQMLFGKDIYSVASATLTNIPNTKLCYRSLNGAEYGYEKYGFIGNSTAFSTSHTLHPYNYNCVGSNEGTTGNKKYLTGWVDSDKYEKNNENTTAKNNRIENRIKTANKYTTTLSNLLSGSNLFIPGSASTNATLTKHALSNGYSDLNKKQTVTSNGGGSVTISSFAMNSANTTTATNATVSSESSTSIQAAYTATVTLTATAASHCKFLGWYDKDWKELGTSTTYTYTAPIDNETVIHAIFGSKKKFRMQIFENKSETSSYDENDWTDSNQGGTLTFSYTKTNSTTYTETIDDANQHSVTDIYPTKTLTITATPKDGYTFIGFWNNESGQIFGKNPWSMTPMDQDESVTARFAKTFTQKVYAYTYNTETDVYDAEGTNGGSVSIVYPKIAYTKEGCEKATATTTGEWSDNVLAENTTMTITASAADGYKFLGWYSTAGEPIDWMNQEGAKVSYTANAAYTIVARFHKPFTQYFDVQTEISGQYQNSTTGGTATIKYNNTTTNITDQQLTISNMEQGTMVTLNATPKDGYRFVGWYNNSGNLDSSNPEYTYRAEGSRTVHARFARNDVQLVVAVMNYNTDYAEFVEYPHDNNTVTIAYGGNNTTVTSSTSAVVNYGSQVTLTANNDERDDGYDFIGWYQNNKRISQETSYTFTITDHSAISAHFAPKKCHKVLIKASLGGIYTVKYAREKWFDTEGMYYTATSQYKNDIEIHVPYDAQISVINPQPIHGYSYLGFKVFKGTKDENKDIYTIKNYNPNDIPQIFANFVRTDEQVVYLDISNKDVEGTIWNNVTKFGCNLRTNFTKENQCESGTKPFEALPNSNTLYKVTIPAEDFDCITIHEMENATNCSSAPEAIPATRYNCYKLNAYKSSTGEWVDAWTTLDTENGDYRLIYIEQKVTSKTEITRTYEFNEGDRIKKVSSGKKTDIVSLHIYNKVSKDNNGNLTGTALNNPEIILQQWNESTKQWEDVEGQRYMVFGPLQTDNTDHVRMPGRKNTVQVVVDKGIDAIKAEKTDATKDYGSGVWNFYITQENGNVKLEVNKTKKYTGKYYIRTTNADGQYNNFTYPGNVMTPSEYAKKNSDFSHYFIRYVDIYEDGTPTATAGKHPVVKFTIANDHAMFLCKELMINNNRFTDDEYGDDLFVKNVDGAPNLPADATVRFGWDIVTNRLTRAYIADTEFKNNEYLVVEGSNIGSPSGEATYFNDNSNWLYSIDLNATADATAKVKAKMNGQYQYFMGAQHGSQNEYETLISGNGTNTYPIRLLYDFKDDRFTTIYRPNGQLNGDISVNTPLMIEREHNYAPTQIQLTTNTVTSTGTGEDQYTQPAYAVMTFLEDKLLDNNVSKYEKMFYWVSFPFRVKIEDVFGLGDYGYYWIMQYYDGAQRALNGLAQTNWKYITDTEAVLEPNKGYIICLNYSQILQDQLFKSHGAGEFGHSKLSLYFPSLDMISPADIKNQSDTVTLAQHPRGNTAWNHWDWHIIGVPSFANPTFKDIQENIPFLYKYWHPDDAYAAVSINDVEFWAMHSYMVQYAGDITWQKVVNATPKTLAAKKNADADKKIMLRLELQQAGSTLDKTYVQLRNDKGTKGFDMSLDLTKIINAGANIYSIVDNHEMAGNAIPKDETVLPLGVVITAAGEYTFAMPNGTEGIIVELIDYEQGTSTNLLVGDYTVNMPVGTNNTRFALRLKPDKVATSVEDITSGTNDNNVRKLLIDGVLYLQQGTNTYDAQGHAIR